MVLISIILIVILVIKLWLNPKLDFWEEYYIDSPKHCTLWFGRKDNRKYIEIY